MHQARGPESDQQLVPDRGADHSAPRSTPLTLVAGAVAGGDLESVAVTVAHSLGHSVAIAIPALGEPVIAPAESIPPDVVAAIATHAAAVAAGRDDLPPPPFADAVAVQIGELTVGIVATVTGQSPDANAAAERRAWLEAAAAAASVTALIQEASEGGGLEPDAVLLAELAAGAPQDLPAFLVRARRRGLDLGSGAVAICARRNGGPAFDTAGLSGVLIAELRAGTVLAVVPVPGADGAEPAAELVARLRQAGCSVVVSAPRRDPSLLHDAVREAQLLAELGSGADLEPPRQDETHRLLIGVLLHDRHELEQLRDTTITPLTDYDAHHDTDLLATLRAFLAHDGSTTETAETMNLHRHTVGYRLSRVHEVSGLSPYESDGRERLSLGLKAHQILAAERRLDEDAPAQ